MAFDSGSGVVTGFGVDIGGSGIKGAEVDLTTGTLRTERIRVPTPRPATPAAVAEVVRTLLDEAGWGGAFGVTVPAVVDRGVARSAANIDPGWIGTDVPALLAAATGRTATALNDADAAGLAEVAFGAARGVSGTVLMLTFGTGIGSALFLDGRLVPNTELGHLELDGHEAEHRAAESARERENLSWPEWAERVERYLRHVDDLLRPDLLVVGGGASRKADRWLPSVDVRPRLVPAALRNEAGIVGAAMAAATATGPTRVRG